MDQVIIERPWFTIERVVPQQHELIAIKEKAGTLIADDIATPALAMSIRLTAEDAVPVATGLRCGQLIGVAMVVEVPDWGLLIQDFIIRPEFAHYGLARVLLEQLLQHVSAHCPKGTKLGILAGTEYRRLCSEFGFEPEQCGAFGLDMVWRG
ncbi:GNAT family N-acetyltransferase [Shewanella cyperi]|uniref:GNAT family N-acetyltransferase n=1 Tax=Shewanella cyperi TaxID=2814292 RepID=A0A974XIP8_9GAMM|nr:GNAT family N-acetyltransferase [Shewanella cyperi]QSX29024.1 GNAT family N-acetyltransferase [Shewanella cyperi]QSX39758.1 GNAT family N-acetyltransferase [Shewanella cyperi]